MASIYDFTLKTGLGEDYSLAQNKGKVMLIVNTATGCGFTPQYEPIEAMYEKYHDQGLEVIDIPCNQFMDQAPGTDEEITSFCRMRYKTQFRSNGTSRSSSSTETAMPSPASSRPPTWPKSRSVSPPCCKRPHALALFYSLLRFAGGFFVRTRTPFDAGGMVEGAESPGYSARPPTPTAFHCPAC